MAPWGANEQANVRRTPFLSGVKHGRDQDGQLGPLLSKLLKTSAEMEEGREPIHLSPDDSKALDFDEPSTNGDAPAPAAVAHPVPTTERPSARGQ